MRHVSETNLDRGDLMGATSRKEARSWEAPNRRPLCFVEDSVVEAVTEPRLHRGILARAEIKIRNK